MTTQKTETEIKYKLYTSINFSRIQNICQKLADLIENRKEELTKILLKYESYEVVNDEIGRTLDLLKNINDVTVKSVNYRNLLFLTIILYKENKRIEENLVLQKDKYTSPFLASMAV